MNEGYNRKGYQTREEFLGGVVAMTRDLAVKWGRWRIRVNALAPGFFPTRMTEKLLPHIEAHLRQVLPLGRPGRPGELEGAVLFLASSASDYITGAVLPVDGCFGPLGQTPRGRSPRAGGA